MLYRVLENGKQIRVETPDRSVRMLAKAATRAMYLEGYSGNARRLMRFFKAKFSA